MKNNIIQPKKPSINICLPIMKCKIYFLLIILFLCTSTTVAQSWQWIKSGGSDDELDTRYQEGVVDMTADNFGNICLLSSVGSNLLQVDGNPKTAYCKGNAQSFMIASFACDGNYRWSKVIGGNNSCFMRDIETDADGNIYAAGLNYDYGGFFIDPIHFDNDVILPLNCTTQGSCSTDYRGLFLIKYNKDGVFQWLRRPQAEGVTYLNNKDFSISLDVDPQGNIFWRCSLQSGTFADGAYVNNLPDNNFIMMKYNTNGDFINANLIDYQTNGNKIIITHKSLRNHNTGTFFILGNKPSAQVGGNENIVIGGIPQVKNRFLAKFDNNGNLLWKKEGTDEQHAGDPGIGICFDNQNNIYYNGIAQYVDYFSDCPPFPDTGNAKPRVTKLDPQGNCIWTTYSDYGFIQGANEIRVNNNEVAIVNGSGGYQWGTFYEPIVPNGGFNATLVRLNKNTGVPIAVEKLTSPFGFTETGKTLVADNYGNYYMGGQFEYEITDGTHTALNDGGQTDFFLAKFGTSNCNLNTQNTNQNQGLNIFPNPVRNNLFVNDQTTLLKFTLYNLLGSKVSSGTLPPLQGQIDFQGLQSGMYLLFLEDTNGFLRKIKVIKE